MKRKVAWLLALLSVSTWFYPDVQPSYADSPPSSPGTGFYVQTWWADPTPWGTPSGYVMKAYRKGWHVNPGSPNPTIYLEFGRQLLTGSGWGVVPIGQPYQTNEWARMIAQAFIDGYNDNPQHPVAQIAVSTNNSNYNWYCNNYDPANLSSYWYSSGYAWGGLITSIASRPKVIVRSGNDIESWIGNFNDWRSCGLGAVSWYEGYEARTYTPNFNFGNNPYSEDNVQWTENQVWQVSWGKATAYVFPQIYCTGSGWSASWVNLRRNQGYMQFNGVTSDNAVSRACDGAYSLTWLDSWHNLNNALTNAGFPNHLRSTSIHMFPVGW